MRFGRVRKDRPRSRRCRAGPRKGGRKGGGLGALGLFLFLVGLLGFASDRSLLPATAPREQEGIASEGLVWRFDEGEGFSVGEAFGRVPTGWLCGARRVAGPTGYGSALHFDGIDDFVLLPNSPHLNPRRALTLALWVYAEKLPDIPWRNDFRFLAAKPSLRAYSLVLEQNGTLNASVYVGGRRQSLRTPRSLPLREWVHVAFTYDGQTGLSRIYLNGVPVAEGRGDRGLLEANGDPLVLGSALFHNSDTADLGGGIRSFPGALDELRLFPWALSPQEVAQLAQLGDSRAREARGREKALPKPARLVVQATLDGRPALARVIAYPEGAPEDCPEVFYTDRPLEAPKEQETFPRPRVHGPADPADLPRGVGVGEVHLPPGEAVVFVDVGGGFTMLPLERRVHLEPGGTIVLPLHLERQWNPRERGYFAADLHLHSHASGDGVTPIEDLVKAQIAADLDLAVLSDHDTAAGHLPFREAAQRLGIPYLLSLEITTSNWGHFNPFPLAPGEAIAVSREKQPREYFAEARAKGARLIQVNHPLWGGGQGYFARMGDPDFDWGFQLVEVINGFDGTLSLTDRRAIEAVFALWSQGRRVVATGGSDDHNAGKLISQAGLPRTYAHVDLAEGEPLTAERWLEALAQGRAFVTTGPLVYLSVGVHGREGLLPGPGARLLLGPDETLRLRTDIESVRELRSLTLWHNGQALRRYALEGYEASVEWAGPARPGWYAVTVEAEGGFALTNPVWVEPLPAREPPRKGGA